MNIFNKLLLVSLVVVSLTACSSPHTTIRGIENQGMIKLFVKPSDARVYVDGTDKGEAGAYDDEETPLVLPSGSHLIEIKKEGYKTFRREVYVGGSSLYEIDVILTK